ncbi:MAG: hypothetical protein PWQ67_2568 [Clostridia bacterium]|jgi:hypothetical protein|nr:hypothetical protein [Clostridia bacterium]MDN5324114.1 hypothetical protein [Clostridia bacterium]
MDVKKTCKGKEKIGLLLITLGWIILIAMFGWVFHAVGWWLLVTLWRKELLIPNNVIATTYMIFTIILLAVVFYLFFLWWTKHDYSKYVKRNRRLKTPLNQNAPYLTNDELLLIIQEESSDQYIPGFKQICKDYIFNKDFEKSDPLKLLSRAKIYNEKKAFKKAASLLRLLISHPQLQPVVKKAALKELDIALQNLGPLAKEASASYTQVKEDS